MHEKFPEKNKSRWTTKLEINKTYKQNVLLGQEGASKY